MSPGAETSGEAQNSAERAAVAVATEVLAILVELAPVAADRGSHTVEPRPGCRPLEPRQDSPSAPDSGQLAQASGAPCR